MRALVCFFFVASACLAQIIIQDPFSSDLKSFLVLSDDQTAKVNGLNSQLQAFWFGKNARRSRVELEIAQETAKPSPDPMELGVRYFELEAIRRQLEDQQRNTATQIQALLTPDQKAKLITLQQALSLYSTAC